MIYRGSRCLIVCDTKYKDKSVPSVDDWYQITAYTLALRAPIGILLYSSSEPRQPECFRIAGRPLWVFYCVLDDPRRHEPELVAFLEERLVEAAQMREDSESDLHRWWASAGA
jgi:hypothetical protein